MPALSSRAALKAAALLAFVLLVLFSGRISDLSGFLSPERIKAWLTDAGPSAPLLYMAAMALAIVVSPIPSVPLAIAAGAFFGPLQGTLYSAAGALVGAVTSFFIARLLGRKLLEPLLKGHLNFCEGCSKRMLTGIVFLSRLVPVISFDVVSYGAGLTKMPALSFALATFFGMLPLTFVYNYFGSVLVVGGWLTAALGAIFVALFLFLPPWLEKRDIPFIRKLMEHTHGGGGGEARKPGK